MRKELQDLTELEIGWDGYNGKQVDSTVAALAENIAKVLDDNFTIPLSPQFVPSGDGSLQIEYHGEKILVEIFIAKK